MSERYPIGTVVVATRPEVCTMTEGVVTGRHSKGAYGEVTYELRVTEIARNGFPNPAVGESRRKSATVLDTYYRIKENPMSNNTINIGDVFVGGRDRTFKELRVTDKVLGYTAKWRCIGTRHDGSTTPTSVYQSTLLIRYTRKSTRDFNVNTDSYSRPTSGGVPVIDVPAVSTALIRDTVTVPRFIGDVTSTLIHVRDDTSEVRQAKGRDAKISLLLQATDGLMMLAVPGKYSQDVFYVDNRDAALGALGLTKSAPVKVVTDALGNTWVAA